MDNTTQANINWVSDLVVKALCGAATILLGIAVNSLSAMNTEIKELSKSVQELAVSSTVVAEAQKTTKNRLSKIEAEAEKNRNLLRDISVEIEVLKKR